MSLRFDILLTREKLFTKQPSGSEENQGKYYNTFTGYSPQ